MPGVGGWVLGRQLVCGMSLDTGDSTLCAVGSIFQPKGESVCVQDTPCAVGGGWVGGTVFCRVSLCDLSCVCVLRATSMSIGAGLGAVLLVCVLWSSPVCQRRKCVSLCADFQAM